MRLSYLQTARIADNMAEMLQAAVPTDRMFAVLLRYRRSRRAREALQEVQRHVAQGEPFYEGFRARPRVWPRYFIELIRCAERAGLLYAGFREGADHFLKMARVHRAAHMLWMGPVAIILFGWLVRGLMWTVLVDIQHGLAFYWTCVRGAWPAALVIVLLVYAPPLRRMFDRACLNLPLIAETVRDLCLYQFTTCFRFLYQGAVSAPDMVRLAAGAVDNSWLARRLAAAAAAVEQGTTFAEALRGKMVWPAGYLARLSEGELSGQLEEVLERLARERKEALEYRVGIVRRAVEPAVGFVTIFAIALTAYQIGMFLQSRRGG